MKNTKILLVTVLATLSFTFTACDRGKDDNKTIIKEPGKTITVIDTNEDKEEEEQPIVSVEKIDPYENIQISDWLDENTVLITKENTELEKMKLAELSETYPKSLYLLNLETKEYDLLKVEENTYLGSASLSADKKYLLYSQYSLGDPAFNIMNLDTKEVFGIHGETIGGAQSAKWADNETVIGASYNGGAYIASTNGDISVLDNFDKEGIYLIEKLGNRVYYNTNYDSSLYIKNIESNEESNLNFENTYDVIPSPDKNQLLILQANDSAMTLTLCDANGENRKTIAEGSEMSGISWSPDQRMIAYNVKGDVNGTTVKGLYLFDLLTSKSVQIAINSGDLVTNWSPLGDKIAYVEWNGNQYNSNIVYLKTND